MSCTPWRLRAPLPVQLNTTLVDGFENAELILGSFSRMKVTPYCSFNKRCKYCMYLGAFTVIVVNVTPNLHPSGISEVARILNCLYISLFRSRAEHISSVGETVLTSLRYSAIDSILVDDGISSQYSYEGVFEIQASTPCSSASFIICP